MFWGSVYYLGVTVLLFALFACIVARTFRRGEKERLEEAKYRMLEDD